MRIHVMATMLIAGLVASGCSPADDRSTSAAGEPDAAEPVDTGDVGPAQEPGDPAGPPVAPADVGMLELQPAALPECGEPSMVTVTWDARPARVSGVDIFAVNRAGKESLFYTGGARGTRETGSWMRSGSQLVLRSKDDGAELDRVLVEATPCVDGVPTN